MSRPAPAAAARAASLCAAAALLHCAAAAQVPSARGFRAARGDGIASGLGCAHELGAPACAAAPPLAPPPAAALAAAAVTLLLAGMALGALLQRRLLAPKADVAASPAPKPAPPRQEASQQTEPARAASAASDAGDAAAAPATPTRPPPPLEDAGAAAANTEAVSPLALLSPASAATLAPALAAGGEERAELEAAGRLVAALAAGLQIDPAALAPGERLQLVTLVLQAWAARGAARHGAAMERLGADGNSTAAAAAAVAAKRAAHERARDAAALARRRTRALRRLCADTQATGVLVMALVTARRLWAAGAFARAVAHCGPLAPGGGGAWGVWGLWPVLQAAEALGCRAAAAAGALVGLAVLAAAPWALYRSGLLSDFSSMPVARQALGLGGVCAWAGAAAVRRLGGDAALWFWLWELWVLCHIVLAAVAHRVCGRAVRAAAARGGRAGAPGALFEPPPPALAAVMWALLGLALPAAAGSLPFGTLRR